MEKYAELFLTMVADVKNISKPEAAREIDRCIKEVSVKLEVSNSDVQKALYTEEFLSNCLHGRCDSKTLEECAQSCNCAIFNDRCIPRTIKDYTLINRDPDKYIKGLVTVELQKLVELSAFLYYNYEGGGLTDNSFDALEWHLNKRMKLRGRQYEKIGAPPVEKIRTALPHPMPSLSKVKPGTRELVEFLRNIPTKLAVSYKLDGVSGMVVYKSGKPAQIYTRGDGEIGGDVSYLKDYIQFPTLKVGNPDIVVRGEFILSKKKWDMKYKELYANARSFVSGQLNQGFISSYLPDIDFVAYDILKIGNDNMLPTPSQRYRILEMHSFNVVTYEILKRQTLTFDLIYKYKASRASSEYAIDGLVLRYEMPGKVQVEAGTPYNDVAFKMVLEEQIRDTKVLDVEWRITRYGKYFPVAIYEAVYSDGVRMHRASAHNAAHIRDWSMGVGTEIKIARVGDAIPQIQDVKIDDSIDPIFPPFTYSWHWFRSDILLDDVDNNRFVQIKRLLHFFSVIQVKGFGEKTAEKLWEAGFKKVRDVTQMTVGQLVAIKGFGPKTAPVMIDRIRNSMRHTPIDRFIEASSTLDIGIGRKIVKSVTAAFPDILIEDRSESEILSLLKSKKIKGIGPKRIENIARNIPIFREFLFDLNRDDVILAMDYQRRRLREMQEQGYNKDVEGGTFVLTGFLNRTDYDLEDYIYDNRGNFSSTVVSSTSAVIAASLSTTTDKMESAHKLGVPVYTVPEFLFKYKIKYKKWEPDS